MGLEYWDPVRRKYLLYRQVGEHAQDCKLYPIEAIPQRIFLDTNVINRLVRWGAQIFEHEPIPPLIDDQVAVDVEALMHVLCGADRTSMQVMGSTKTLEELGNTRDPVWRKALLNYGVELVDQNTENEDRQFALEFARSLKGSKFVAPLPDLADQELIGHAIGLRCDTFCTCDRRTIWSKRDQLRQLPIRIMTPVEWWAHVKPWAGLWS